MKSERLLMTEYAWLWICAFSGIGAALATWLSFRFRQQDTNTRVLKNLASMMDARKENLESEIGATLATLLIPQHARHVILWQDFTDELPSRLDQSDIRDIPLERWKTFQGLSRQSWLYGALKQGEVVAIDDVDTLSQHASREQKALQETGIHSALFIPVVRGNKLVAVYGLIGDTGHRWVNAKLITVLVNLLTAVLMGQNTAHLRPLADGQVKSAQYDALTGLPNRLLAIRRLEQAVANCKNACVACIIVGLDTFKKVNETLGHQAGDILLQEAAVRLKEQLRSDDIVARLGGDEFMIIMPSTQKDQAEKVATHINDVFAQPFQCGRERVTVTASAGIALSPDNGKDARTLLRNADSAMHRAKDSGRNRFQFYAQKMHEDALKRVQMEQHLRLALERDELELFYQPIINARTSKIDGAEGLIRWHNPKLGFISPLDFIPLAEDIGEIVPIGVWVIETACLQMKKWSRLKDAPRFVTVNVSAKQIEQSNFSAQVADVLKKTGVKPEKIHLEVTESLLMGDIETVEEELTALSQMGVHISLDDFGTGYSSLSYLKRYNFNTLKIDRSFVRDVPEDDEDKALIEAIMAMAHSLKMSVVAEGVETEKQCLYLTDLHCDQLQGYFFSKPLPADEFKAFIKQWQGNIA